MGELSGEVLVGVGILAAATCGNAGGGQIPFAAPEAETTSASVKKSSKDRRSTAFRLSRPQMR